MGTRFLFNDELWQEIQSRVAGGKRIRAAIAYFGGNGAKLLSLKEGDSIVVDMTMSSVRQGITNPTEVRKLFRRGVRIFSRGSLHAKFLLIDKTLIASSANVSRNSREILDEAGIITSDSAAVRRASEFFDKLCTEPVGEAFLRKCIGEYRPPKFKPAVEPRRPRSKGQQRVVEAKLWFVGGLATLNLSEDVRNSIERVERPYKKQLKRPEKTEVSWLRFGQEPKYMRHIRVGDWIVGCIKDGPARYVGPPTRVLGFDWWVSDSGKRYRMVMLESPRDGEEMTLSQFRKKIAAVQPELNRSNPRTRAIEDNDRADRILRLWTETGRISKRI